MLSLIEDWRKRIFAALLARGCSGHERLVAERKRALFGGLAGDVLEIGPGAGPNLAYYSPHVRWVGVEPNPYMHGYLYATAERHGLAVDLHLGHAEALPAADASMDAVVSTLVLCSVDDQARSLAEILRVLRPGGKFFFVEHVAAPEDTRLRTVQNLLRPGWQVVGDGCRPNRETGKAIEQAGFARVHIDAFDMPLPVIGPHIAGFAVKG